MTSTATTPNGDIASRTILTAQRLAAIWRHAFVYFWLLFATVSSLLDGAVSTVEGGLSLLLVGALGGWYWHWQVAGRGRGAAGPGGVGVAGRSGSPSRVYFVGALAVWALLVVLDPGFVVAGVSVFAPYCFDSVRWALVSLVPCVGMWLWSDFAVDGSLDWAEVVVALVVVASGVAVAGYVGALNRQNTERQALIDQLRAAQSELADAERRAGVLAERQRLARDIHDTLTQGFASIVMLLEAADASLVGEQGARRHVTAALRSARDNLAESRRLVWALRPDVLTDGRLPEALRELVTRLGDETGLRTELIVTGSPCDLGEQVETGLLRLTQEALANVRKHAEARRATVTVSYMDDVTVLDVQDDGVGFDPARVVGPDASARGGLGLRAMRERAEELGGRLVVETTPGEGTTVVAEIPTAPADVAPSAAPSVPAAQGTGR